MMSQTTSENYIIKKVYKSETTTPVAPQSTENVDASITYFDGLGRPKQQIAVGKSGTGTNMVTPMVYDGFGRSYREYLSAPTSNSSFDYVPNAENVVKDYSIYNGQLPYSEKLFDNSPLNRVVKQSAPGTSWTMGSNHEIKLNYQTNKVSEVEMFKVNLTASTDGSFFNPSLIKQGFYPKNQLYKTVTKDENWTSGNSNTTEEFKDKDGKILLKRTYVNVKLANGFNQLKTVNTYYVYDQYGNLTFVIPPMVDVSVTIIESVLNGLCYQYKYDVKNRLVEKKLPGKQWEFIVYDKLSRVIASSTATSPFNNMSNSGWLITKYDEFNRAVITAWMASEITSATRNTLQNSRNLDTNDKLSEIKNSSATNNSINNIIFRYSNKVWPAYGHHILTVNYYDDYNFPNAPTNIPTTVLTDNSQAIYYNNSIKPKGLNTGSWTRILENTTDISGEESYLLYDNKARVVRTYTKNYLGGFLQIDSKIDFAGKTLRTETKHKKQNQDPAELLVKEEFEYTDQDRLLSHSHKINSMPAQLLAANQYDGIGQLVLKMVGSTTISGAGALQNINYQYNIRGWLTAINDVESNQSVNNSQDLFSFKINYDQVAGTNIVAPLYNGNISETYWRTASSNTKRSYGYQYDNLNRLTKAIYQKSDAVSNAYNEELSYDLNGNILTLARTGEQDYGSPATLAIDELVYTYDAANKNQLIKVTDLTNHSAGFSDGANNTIEYGYDNNGNMIRDDNKGIESITYNHLNLPTQIIFSRTTRINYIYDAVGRKQKKIVTAFPRPTTTTDYLSGFQYQDNVLEFFPHAEGYVKYTEGYFNYVFNYTDHLGNVRLSYAKDPNGGATRIMEENHYYPFGLKHTNYDNATQRFMRAIGDGPGNEPVIIAPDIFGSAAYKYKYNGKELQDELGLNLYDYGARNYDPAIGRWNVTDNKAELYFGRSPYIYALNTPVQAIDPDGNLVIFINGQHMGDGGKSDYWRKTEEREYSTAFGPMTTKVSMNFDQDVMDRLGDYNAIYRDGSMGGFVNTFSGGGSVFGTWGTIFGTSNLNSANRTNGGYSQGMKDAKQIIASLARDKEGNITESIKIISHSMGGSYAKGYAKAILEYAKKHNIKDLIIAFEADFAPFQPDKQSAVKGKNMGATLQFSHSEDSVAGNKSMPGAENQDTSEDKGQGHSIFDFFNQIKNLPSGTYNINGIKLTIK